MKKEKQIKKIMKWLDELELDEIQVTELANETTINIGDLANGDITECVGTIRRNDVGTTVYHNGNEIEWCDKDYDSLSLEVLEEIVEALQYHKIDTDKTLDVIRDEDF